MNTDTAENPKRPVKVVLDTNTLISAVGFSGNPRKILKLALAGKIKPIASPILIAEIGDVVAKKFPELKDDYDLLEKKIRKKFKVVKPAVHLSIVRDYDDNRVLEAAVEGKCNYIVTGDRNLLDLGIHDNIKNVRAKDFLKEFEV